MLDFPRWKVWLTVLTMVIGVGFALPSVLPPSVTRYLPANFASTKVNRSPDLPRVSHLLLEADCRGVAKQRIERV